MARVLAAAMAREVLWPRDAVVSLCKLVQPHKGAWDPREADYPVQCVFSDIARVLRARYPQLITLTAEMTQTKFQTLKKHYLKECKRVQKALNGSELKVFAVWEFYEHLGYLSDVDEVVASDPLSLSSAQHKSVDGLLSVPEHLSPTVLEIGEDWSLYTEPVEEGCVSQLSEINQSNCATLLPESSAPTPSSSSSRFFHSPPPLSPGSSESESETLGLSGTRPEKRRRTQHCDQATNLAVKVAPSDNTLPPYSHCIASAVENIINQCPDDKQMECGQLILTAAVKILMDMKRNTQSLQ